MAPSGSIRPDHARIANQALTKLVSPSIPREVFSADEGNTNFEFQMKTNRIVLGFAGARASANGFTLVELLVVIVVIAILAILLAPALARTDDNGARMVCMHNLRQMGMACNMYCGDNRETFAYPNWDGGSAAGAPRGWLYSMNPLQGLPAGYPAGIVPNPYSSAIPYKLLPNALAAWQSGVWFQYVLNPKSYLCPVDIESADYKPPSGSNGRVNKLSSYVMNGAVTGYPAPGYGTPCKLTDVWNPACYLLWEPDENAVGAGNPGPYEYNDGANYPGNSEGIGRLHSANGGEMMSVDGSVKFVTVQTWKIQNGTGPGPGGRTLTWWNPL
jgi:prepilin-type N-terminal cleavage/methylation domain-containing protein